MRAQVTLHPGQKGTKGLVDQYGSKLICVRYRYDEPSRRRLKTVEIIVEEKAWQPKFPEINSKEIVGVRISLNEVELQRRVKLAGAKWNSARRVWEMQHDKAVSLVINGKLSLTDKWRAGCSESCKSGSVRGVEKRAVPRENRIKQPRRRALLLLYPRMLFQRP
jgi:hypothetical protein